MNHTRTSDASRRKAVSASVVFRIVILSLLALLLVVPHLRKGHGAVDDRGWVCIAFAVALYNNSQIAGGFPYDPRGSEYALYNLQYMDDRLRDRITDSREVRVMDESANKAQHRAEWDDTTGRLLHDGLDYFHVPFEELLLKTESLGDVVVLTYRRSAWSVHDDMPFYSSLEHTTIPVGVYKPWVRPRRLSGLPVREVQLVSDYGAYWGVRLGDAPIRRH